MLFERPWGLLPLEVRVGCVYSSAFQDNIRNGPASGTFPQGLPHAQVYCLISGARLPGVVAAVSRILEENGCNIEEVTQTILSGEFAAIFVVAAPDGTDAESLRQNLSASLAEAKVDLSVLVRPAIKGQWGQNLHCEPFVVTADGPDKPGLIAAMSRVFARHDVNIESLKAILGEGGTNRALFVFEVMVPDSVDLGRLRRELTCEGQSRDLRVSVQHRDIFEAVNRVNSF